jgi:molybdopterin/thiamine biosynthesis adenylyltransferase
MSTNWRISSFTGALLAAYFVPTWTILAYRIVLSPIHSFYERPNVSVAFFASDYLHLAATGMVRTAWLLALGRLIVAAFLVVFVLLLTRSAIRRTGGCDEALCVALGIGSVICFAMMLMASLVHEVEAMRLHATELLMLLGTTIVLMIEGPARAQTEERTEALASGETDLLHNR